jgi:hypothetical protein
LASKFAKLIFLTSKKISKNVDFESVEKVVKKCSVKKLQAKQV